MGLQRSSANLSCKGFCSTSVYYEVRIRSSEQKCSEDLFLYKKLLPAKTSDFTDKCEYNKTIYA